MKTRKIIKRQAKIVKRVKGAFQLKDVGATFTNDEGRFMLNITYCGMFWRSLQVSIREPISEIVERVKSALISGKWDDTYTLSPITIVTKGLLEQYSLSECDYFLAQNNLYWTGDGKAEKVLNLEDAVKYIVEIDECDDATLIYCTDEKQITVSYEGYEVRPLAA